MLELLEVKNKTHILSKKLPVDLDNRLYSMIHLIGGMDFRDVIRFANNASFDQVTELQQKVEQFPSTIEEIMPYVGGFHYLRDSKEYNDIFYDYMVSIKDQTEHKFDKDIESNKKKIEEAKAIMKENEDNIEANNKVIQQKQTEHQKKLDEAEQL